MLVLKKTITNDDGGARPASTALVVRPRDGDGDGRCDSSAASASDTSRTSIGRSVRAGYGTYSERFLAERDEEVRAAAEAVRGRPRTLALTAGPADVGGDDAPPSGGGSADPEADHDGGRGGGPGGFNSSTRRGVYGGGVRYFTPVRYDEEDSYEDDDEDDDDFDDEDDDDFDEEDSYESSDEDLSEGESRRPGRYGEDGSGMEAGSDLGSMVSGSEGGGRGRRGGAGVESVTSSSLGGD